MSLVEGGAPARRMRPSRSRRLTGVAFTSHPPCSPEPKERALDEVKTAPDFAADHRASLFVFPSAPPPVLGTSVARQVDGMNDATTTEPPETSELRATFLLFALVLILPALLGCALLGIR
jgi:hypothetical protein